MKNTLLILFVLIFSLNSFSQDKTEWKTINGPENSFSISLPSNFVFFKEAQEYKLHGFLDGVQMSVRIYKNSHPKQQLNFFRLNASKNKSETISFSKDDFKGDLYKSDNEKLYVSSVFMFSSKFTYYISVNSNEPDNLISAKFLQTIRINNAPLFRQTISEIAKSNSTVNIESLENNSEVQAALKVPDAEKQEIKYDLKKKEPTDKDKENIKLSRSVIMIRKPHPYYTDGARQNNISGTVVLKILFKADGKIGDITVISDLPGGLTNEAVKAARKIKFLPAQVDGKPIDFTKSIQYTFTIY